MFKNKTLPWKTPKPSFVAFFVLIGMVPNLFLKLEPGIKLGSHVVNFVCSYANQVYPKDISRYGSSTNQATQKTLFTGWVYDIR